MVAGAAALASLPSTSGRSLHAIEARRGAALSQFGFWQESASRRQRQAAAPCSPVVAAFGRQKYKKAYNKYKTRQQLEEDYYKEWDATTRQAEREGKRPMTLLTHLAFLPAWFKFYVIPGPIRYLWWLVWLVIQEAAYQLRKKAVIEGAKLDVATMQRRGITAGYSLRVTALRRMHGKDSLVAPLVFAMGGRLA